MHPRQNKVTINWHIFNEKITTILTITTDPAELFPYILTPDHRVLVANDSWTNYVIPQIDYLPVANQFHLPR